jgi:hypothetical protein
MRMEKEILYRNSFLPNQKKWRCRRRGSAMLRWCKEVLENGAGVRCRNWRSDGS